MHAIDATFVKFERFKNRNRSIIEEAISRTPQEDFINFTLHAKTAVCSRSYQQ